MDFAAFPSGLAGKYTGDNGGSVGVLIHAVRPKGNGVEYLCVDSTGRSYLLDSGSITFDKVPAGEAINLGKAKRGPKKSK